MGSIWPHALKPGSLSGHPGTGWCEVGPTVPLSEGADHAARPVRHQLFLHVFTELLPSSDPGPRCFLVDTLGQSGNAHSTDESALNGERHSATDEIDLARIHVYDAEVSVRAFLCEIGQDFRGLPKNGRCERLAFGKASVVDCSTVHLISRHQISRGVHYNDRHVQILVAGERDRAVDDGACFGERDQRWR